MELQNGTGGGGGGSPLTISDGNTSVSDVTFIEFTGVTATDLGLGEVEISTSPIYAYAYFIS